MVIISYDLKKHRQYQPLWTALQQLGATRLLESLWVANLSVSCEELRSVLSRYIDSDDALVVINVPAGSDWATLRARQAGVQKLGELGPWQHV